VGIKRRGASGLHLIFTEQFSQGFAFLTPLVGWNSGKNLWDAAPADIANERRLFLHGRFAPFRLNPVESFNRGNVLAKLLLEGAAPDFIGVSDPIIAEVLLYDCSGGSRIYLSRTISHAVSWACWGL